jgi:(E)-4-hydroxy-3-methylbut-2-enyl-diphosphate synthase
MIKRRKTITVKVDHLKIGSRFPIVVQSMTKVPTIDVRRCVRQINQLIRAGCALVRLAVPTREDTKAFGEIVQKVSVPLIADIHFSANRAIEAIEAGAAKVRLNPGNIKNRNDINRVIDAAKLHKIAVRVGVNEASIRELNKAEVPHEKRVALMSKELQKYVRLFEKRKFSRLVLSAKSSDLLRTIEVNRRIAQKFAYPIHIGLTHAGLPEDAKVPSAVGLGTLLAEGIGDTIRVSAAGNPLVEVRMAKQILIALSLYENAEPNLQLVVCPTCARAQVDVTRLARKIRRALGAIKKPLRVAVMGCIVNGPGEAADADIAVCTAKTKAYIYRKGRRISIVPERQIIPELMNHLESL